jgi:hypothetical protein
MIDRNRSCAAGSSFAGPAQRLDETQNGGQRRAQLVADIGDEVAAHFLGLAQMGDVGEMQKKRIAARRAPPRRPAPPSHPQRGDAHPELRAPALSANSNRASPGVPSACTVSIRPRIDGCRRTVA